MRGIAFAFVAITFVATTPYPVAAQCYGPECDRHRSSPPAYHDERPNFHSNSANTGSPIVQHRMIKGNGTKVNLPGQPLIKGNPIKDTIRAPLSADLSTACLSSAAPTTHGLLRHAAWHGAAGAGPPPGMSRWPDGSTNPGHADSKGDKVCRSPASTRPERSHSRKKRFAHRRRRRNHHFSGKDRHRQSQARELQRLLSARAGAPTRGSAFPDVRPPAAGKPKQ